VNSSRRGDGLSSPASRIREKRADSARRRRKMKLSTPRATAGRNATRHPQSEYCDSLSTASRRRGTAKASVHPATTLEVAKRGQGGDQAGRGEHGLAPVGIGVGAHDWGAAAHGGAGKRRASKSAARARSRRRGGSRCRRTRVRGGAARDVRRGLRARRVRRCRREPRRRLRGSLRPWSSGVAGAAVLPRWRPRRRPR
jgi:hypothetical protein